MRNSKNSVLKNILLSTLVLCVTVQTMTLLTNIVEAYVIEVDVKGIIESEVTSFYYDSSTALVKFNIEVQNRGSIAYSVRTRVDVFDISETNETRQVFTAWSPERDFAPGDKKIFKLYWYSDDTGDFVARVRIYHAGEILERFFELEKKPSAITFESTTDGEDTKELFVVRDFRVYDDFIIFDLVAKTDAEDVFIVPDSFTGGWIFEQVKVNSMNEGTIKTIVLPYQASAFAEDNVTLSIVSEDYKLYSEKTLTLSKEQGINSLVFSIIDSIKLFLSRYQ